MISLIWFVRKTSAPVEKAWYLSAVSPPPGFLEVLLALKGLHGSPTGWRSYWPWDKLCSPFGARKTQTIATHLPDDLLTLAFVSAAAVFSAFASVYADAVFVALPLYMLLPSLLLLFLYLC